MNDSLISPPSDNKLILPCMFSAISINILIVFRFSPLVLTGNAAAGCGKRRQEESRLLPPQYDKYDKVHDSALTVPTSCMALGTSLMAR